MKIKILVISGIILVLIGGLFWWFSENKMRLISPKTNTTSTALLSYNDAFRKGREAAAKGLFADAERYYLEALAQPGLSEREKNFIRLALAWIYAQEGKFTDAISLEKDIADKYADAPDIKGFALQALGTFPEIFPSNAELIGELTFSGTPYQGFLENGNVTAISYRELNDYALTFNNYLPLANLYVASWYANRLSEPKLSQVEKESYIQHIHEYIVNGDNGIKDYSTSSFTDQQYLQIVYAAKKGNLIEKLNAAGDTAYGTGDQYFKEAINNARNNEEKAMALYYYAFFLSKKNDPNLTTTIQELLGQIYNDQNVKSAMFISSFKTDDPDKRKRLRTLAIIDPQFKEFLITLGWSESDFQ